MLKAIFPKSKKFLKKAKVNIFLGDHGQSSLVSCTEPGLSFLGITLTEHSVYF